MKYEVFAGQMATVYIGSVEAESKEEAEEKADKLWEEEGGKIPNDTMNIHNDFDLNDAELILIEDD